MNNANDQKPTPEQQDECEKAFNRWEFSPRMVPTARDKLKHCAFQVGFATATELSRDRIEKLEKALEYVKRWWDETGRDQGWHDSIGKHIDHALSELEEKK